VAYQYSLYAPVEYLPDCAATTLEGTVWDLEPPNQLGGIRLKVCDEGEYWCGDLYTGPDADKGEGYYGAQLWPEPKEGHWWVAVVDAQGRALSEAVIFQTDTHDCDPDGTGRQWVIIDFQRNYRPEED
jgi:hypothetical protein